MLSKGSTSDEHLKFIRMQVEIKISAGRYSTSFGPGLLPRMCSSPVYAIPKPPNTFRLINHMLYGNHSPNSMILRENVAGICMDKIMLLETALL